MRLRYKLEWLGSTSVRRDLVPGRYLLGRGGASDLVFDVPGVSREHAELIVCGDRGVLVRDLGSTNGTRVDGVRIDEGAWCGDIDLSLGSVQLRLRERGGLDGMALLLESAPAPTCAPPVEAPTAAPTAALSLLRELRLAIDECRPPVPGTWPIDALNRLLQRWCQLADAAHLRLQDSAAGAVLAQAGDADHAAAEPARRTRVVAVGRRCRGGGRHPRTGRGRWRTIALGAAGGTPAVAAPAPIAPPRLAGPAELRTSDARHPGAAGARRRRSRSACCCSARPVSARS